MALRLTTLTRTDRGAAPNGHCASALAERLADRAARVAVMGLGYAGLPMAVELARAGFSVTGLDVNPDRVELIEQGKSPVSDVSDIVLSGVVGSGKLIASCDFSALAGADCVFICVPTPITADRRPDLRYIQAAAEAIGAHLHPSMLVILQSTCSPGTTREVLLPILEARSGLQVGEDFFLAFAPERIDPGNTRYNLRNTPKLVGGMTPRCADLAALLFAPVMEQVLKVSSPDVAETAKLLENTFRFINISLVNELAQVCDRLDVDLWEVIDAAATKPFAFMPHYPGPGVGGDCIPVVPFYLQAAARQHDTWSELIEAAGRVNDSMPVFVVEKLRRVLAERGRAFHNQRVLLLGMAYKADAADTRESPALRVLERLREEGVDVEYYDPLVPRVMVGDAIITSLSAAELESQPFDCAVLLTAHSGLDYARIAKKVGLVLDTRNHLGLLRGNGNGRHLDIVPL